MTRGYLELCLSGGMRSGKSMAMALAIYRYISTPNTNVLLAGRNMSDIRRSTLKLLLWGETMPSGVWRPPLIPPQAIRSKDYINGLITLWNNSTITLPGLADETKVRSLAFSACFVEEVTRVSENAYKEVVMRASQYHAGAVS